MLTKFGNPIPDGKTRVKILRGYQEFEVGSVVDLPTKDIQYLLNRKVVQVVDVVNEADALDPKEKEIREKLFNETQTRVVEPQQNRAVGLDKSPKAPAKKRTRKKKSD